MVTIIFPRAGEYSVYCDISYKKGGVDCEPNPPHGTLVIDVTDPKKPAHTPKAHHTLKVHHTTKTRHTLKTHHTLKVHTLAHTPAPKPKPKAVAKVYEPLETTTKTLAMILQQIKRGTGAMIKEVIKHDIETFSAEDVNELNKSPIAKFIKQYESSSTFFKSAEIFKIPPPENTPASKAYYTKIWSDIYTALKPIKNAGISSPPYIKTYIFLKKFIFELFKAYLEQYRIGGLPDDATISEKAAKLHPDFQENIGDIILLKDSTHPAAGTVKKNLYDMLFIKHEELTAYAEGKLPKVPEILLKGTTPTKK